MIDEFLYENNLHIRRPENIRSITRRTENLSIWSQKVLFEAKLYKASTWKTIGFLYQKMFYLHYLFFSAL